MEIFFVGMTCVGGLGELARILYIYCFFFQSVYLQKIKSCSSFGKLIKQTIKHTNVILECIVRHTLILTELSQHMICWYLSHMRKRIR